MTDKELTLSWANKEKEYPLFDDYNCSGTAHEPNCDDILEFRLLIDQFGLVRKVGFSLPDSACPPIRACATYVCANILNKPILLAYTYNAGKIAYALSNDGQVNKEHVHCTLMAELALKQALAQYGEKFKK